MANASIGGLVSGLDTATIISQLMQLEARPQTTLKSRVSSAERAVTALQTFNSKLANLATKAADLARTAAWTALKATSDSANVTVTAAGTAATGTLGFDVVRTALSTTRTFGTALKPTDNAATTTSLTIDHVDPTRDRTITLTDTSLAGVAAALNDPANNTGVSATLVRAGGTDQDPTYRLVVTSTATGLGSGFTVDDGSGAFLGGSTVTTSGRDAEITVNGSPLTSTTNTFKGLMPGVDVTLSAKATAGPVTITVVKDAQSLADKVKALVDVVNTALAEIDSLTATGADPKSRGLLSGDPTLRQVRNELLQAVTHGVGGASLAPYGVSTDRTGKLVFDEAKLKTAYEADPTKTAAMFAGTATWAAGSTGTATLSGATWRTAEGDHTVDAVANTINGSAATRSGSLLSGATGTRADGLALTVSADAGGTITYRQGLAAKLEAIAQRASDATAGVVSLSIKSRQDAIRGMQDDIADWDVRLETRRNALQRQYTALETALGKLQSQGNWLAGQLASLPQMNSGQ